MTKRLRAIVFAAQKGGAGKTTLAAMLAVAAAQSGEKVLAIDVDPQGSLSAWGERRNGNGQTGQRLVVDRLAIDRMRHLPALLDALVEIFRTLSPPGLVSLNTRPEGRQPLKLRLCGVGSIRGWRMAQTMAKRRPSILQGLQLDCEGIEASPLDALTPVKPRSAKPESGEAGRTLPLLFRVCRPLLRRPLGVFAK